MELLSGQLQQTVRSRIRRGGSLQSLENIGVLCRKRRQRKCSGTDRRSMPAGRQRRQLHRFRRQRSHTRRLRLLRRARTGRFRRYANHLAAPVGRPLRRLQRLSGRCTTAGIRLRRRAERRLPDDRHRHLLPRIRPCAGLARLLRHRLLGIGRHRPGAGEFLADVFGQL